MALATIPTFTASGYLQMSTPPAPLPNASSTAYPPLYGSVPNTLALPAGSSPATVLIQNLGPEPAIVLLTTAAATTTGTVAAGSMAMTVASGTSIAVGQAVIDSAGKLKQGTFVAAVSGTAVTLSQPALGAMSGAAVNFVVPVTLSTGIAVTPWWPLALAYVASGFISAISASPGSRSVLNVAVGV
jgi:hypothetical protein